MHSGHDGKAKVTNSYSRLLSSTPGFVCQGATFASSEGGGGPGAHTQSRALQRRSAACAFRRGHRLSIVSGRGRVPVP